MFTSQPWINLDEARTQHLSPESQTIVAPFYPCIIYLLEGRLSFHLACIPADAYAIYAIFQFISLGNWVWRPLMALMHWLHARGMQDK
jgi:hypothetical protein